MSNIGQNRDRAKRYELNGESHTLREWSKISGVAVNKLYNRLRRGYTLEEAMSTSVDLRLHPRKRKGETQKRGGENEHTRQMDTLPRFDE